MILDLVRGIHRGAKKVRGPVKSVFWGKPKFNYLKVQVHIQGPAELNSIQSRGSQYEEFRTWRDQGQRERTGERVGEWAQKWMTKWVVLD
jgi:hypothetical protein